MGLNNDGYSGVEIEQIALEKTVLVGTQAPNVFPCIKIDDNGKSLPLMKVTESGGTHIAKTAGVEYGYIDTSWLSHGGIYSLAVGNKINITCGAGGFEWITSGPSRLNTPYQDFLCTHCFNINTRLFTVAATERAHVMGGRLDLQFDQIYLQGNTNFTNNVHINGSLFVNGELFCSHMTSMGQTNFTGVSSSVKGFINPAQSFVVFNGASAATKEIGILPMENAIPEKIGGVVATISANLPVIGMIDVPCVLTFPKGISLLSDALFNMKPDLAKDVQTANTREIGCGINKADFSAPGHVHSYIGPSVATNANDTGSVYKEAKEHMESTTPSTAKPTVPNGAAALEQVPDMLVKATQNSITEYLKELWDDINPFKNIPWI